MAFKDIFIHFAVWTNSHGIPRINGAANQFWRVFWVIVTLICVGMLMWNIQMNVAKYLTYGVSVTPDVGLIGHLEAEKH